MRLSTLLLVGTALGIGAAAFDNSVYLIRHGEKPRRGNGLSVEGEHRADCIEDLFGEYSDYNIGYILAPQPLENGKRSRPLETVKPLARSLGLTVDSSCDRDDSHCVSKAIKAFAKHSDKNVLVCWEHKELRHIMHALDVKRPPRYPRHAYDVIYTVRHKTVVSKTSEDCPCLD